MIDVVSAVIVNARGAVLIALRNKHGSAASCWETPGGKVDPGESHEAALRREITEELGVELSSVGCHVAAVTIRTETGAYATITFYAATLPPDAVPKRLAGQQRLRWVQADNLPDYRMTAGNMSAMGAVINFLRCTYAAQV